MHSKGTFPLAQRFSDPESDRLVEAARLETDPARRRALYARLLEREFEEVPHVLISDVRRFRAQGSWVHGWIDNPAFPGAPYSTYFYPVWKE
jgi:peptide/nickel transport system substrate-binding protein